MGIILDKELMRESTVKFDNREIQITLTTDQKISFKLKGLKSGVLTIGIEELYKQLANVGDLDVKEDKKNKGENDNHMISLYALRTNNLVTKMDFNVKMTLEKLICDLIKQEIKIFDNE